MTPDVILETLKTYGAWGLLFVVVLYVVLKGELTFRYPRRPRVSNKKNV